ncbi:hypothetical protein BDR22DRAFT_904704, partial [Usnea florida]
PLNKETSTHNKSPWYNDIVVCCIKRIRDHESHTLIPSNIGKILNSFFSFCRGVLIFSPIHFFIPFPKNQRRKSTKRNRNPKMGCAPSHPRPHSQSHSHSHRQTPTHQRQTHTHRRHTSTTTYHDKPPSKNNYITHHLRAAQERRLLVEKDAWEKLERERKEREKEKREREEAENERRRKRYEPIEARKREFRRHWEERQRMKGRWVEEMSSVLN